MKTPQPIESSIIRQYLCGDKTVREIAESHVVNPVTVHRIINRHKVERRTDSRWLPTWADIEDARTSLKLSGERVTTERLATYLRCSRTVVLRLHAANGGIAFDSLGPDEEAEIVAGYQGMSIRNLARKHRRHISTISAVLISNGVTPRRRGRRPSLPIRFPPPS